MEQRTTELEQLVRATGQSVDKLEVLASLLEKKVHRNHFLLMQVPRDRYKVPFTLYCTLYSTLQQRLYSLSKKFMVTAAASARRVFSC